MSSNCNEDIVSNEKSDVIVKNEGGRKMLTIKNWEEYTYYLLMYLKRQQKAHFRMDFFQLHPTNQVDFFRLLDKEKRQCFYHFTDPKELAVIFSHLALQEQNEIMEELDEQYALAMIKELRTDDAVDFFKESRKDLTARYLSLMDEKTAKKIKTFMMYEKETIGSLMTTEFVTAEASETVEQVLLRLRHEGKLAETIYYIYVVNEKKRLIGVVSLRELIVSHPQDALLHIMKEHLITASTNMEQEKAVAIIEEYDLLAVPVVNHDDEMIGIITVDDVLDVMQKEALQDRREYTAANMENNLLKVAKIRLPWLLLLLFLSVFTIKIIAASTLKADYLSIFTPLMAIIAVHTGVQSQSVVQRKLSQNELDKKTFVKLCKREAIIASLLGIVCGFFTAILGYFVINSMTKSAILGVSMLVNIFICTLTGTMVPFIIHRLKIDPDVASSPFMIIINTTISILLCFIATSFI